MHCDRNNHTVDCFCHLHGKPRRSAVCPLGTHIGWLHPKFPTSEQSTLSTIVQEQRWFPYQWWVSSTPSPSQESNFLLLHNRSSPYKYCILLSFILYFQFMGHQVWCYYTYPKKKKKIVWCYCANDRWCINSSLSTLLLHHLRGFFFFLW